MSQCPESLFSIRCGILWGGLTASGDRQAAGRLATWVTLHDTGPTCELAIPDITQGKQAWNPKLPWLF